MQGKNPDRRVLGDQKVPKKRAKLNFFGLFSQEHPTQKNVKNIQGGFV